MCVHKCTWAFRKVEDLHVCLSCNLFILDDSLTKLKLSLMQKVSTSDGRSVWECVQCGKTHHNKSNILQHVDLHIQGATYTCHFCQKQFKSQGSLNVHTTTKHRDAKRMEKLNANLNY